LFIAPYGEETVLRGHVRGELVVRLRRRRRIVCPRDGRAEDGSTQKRR
jgi:hypothetical protein